MERPDPPGPGFRIEPLGDRALLLVFGERIDEALNAAVHAFAARLREEALPGVRDLVPGYATLGVHFDPTAWASANLSAALLSLWREAPDQPPAPPRTIEIPVRYGGEDGPDLEEVARHCGLPEVEVVARHTAATYRVYMLGFSPGFAYLGGLDPALATPRRPAPRLKLRAGSVGIAGPQTGIYPLESPGGWQIIGRTPLALFDHGSGTPCLLGPGDRLRFVELRP